MTGARKPTQLTTSKPSTQSQTEPTVREQRGLLGGSFNPVHYGHLVIADQVAVQLGLNRVDLVPSYEPPHVDQKQTIAAEYRLEMLQLATAMNPRLGIETCELERQGKSYTIDTIRSLQEREPNVDFFFIIGGDMVDYLPKWAQIDELMERVQFVAVKRPGFSEVSPYPLIWVDVPEVSYSSTLIRRNVQNGCSIRYLVPEKVERYIQERKLYHESI